MLRVRAADVPIRIRSSVVQVDVSTAVRAVVGVTTDKRDRKAEASEGAHNIPIFSIFFMLTLQGGLLPLSPCAAYAAKGSSQEGEPPMLQAALEAVLLKLTQAPQYAPLLVKPPTSATARIAMLIQ